MIYFYNEEISCAQYALMCAVQEVRNFVSTGVSDEQIVKLLIAVLQTPGALSVSSNSRKVWDAVRECDL